MGTRKFKIEFSTSVDIELDDQVIDVVDAAWRADLYDLRTPEEIAEMVGLCLVRGWRLSTMDGWADQPDSNARLIDFDDFEDVEVTEYKRP